MASPFSPRHYVAMYGDINTCDPWNSWHIHGRICTRRPHLNTHIIYMTPRSLAMTPKYTSTARQKYGARRRTSIIKLACAHATHLLPTPPASGDKPSPLCLNRLYQSHTPPFMSPLPIPFSLLLTLPLIRPCLRCRRQTAIHSSQLLTVLPCPTGLIIPFCSRRYLENAKVVVSWILCWCRLMWSCGDSLLTLNEHGSEGTKETSPHPHGMKRSKVLVGSLKDTLA